MKDKQSKEHFPYGDVVHVETDEKNVYFLDGKGKTLLRGSPDDAGIMTTFENVKAVGYAKLFANVLVNDLFCINVDHVTKGLGELLHSVEAMNKNGVDVELVGREFFGEFLDAIGKVKAIPTHDIIESGEIH